MHASHHTLSLLAADLAQQLRGSSIDGLFTQERDELCIAFAGRPECLFVSCAPDLPILFLHESFARAKRNSTDVLTRANGDRVEEVSIHPSDRVLDLTLASGCCLEVHLFGPHANVFLLDQQRMVLDAFKKSRRLAGAQLPWATVAAPPLLSRLIARRKDDAEFSAAATAGAAPAIPPQRAAQDNLHNSGTEHTHRANRAASQERPPPPVSHNAARERADDTGHTERAVPATVSAALKGELPVVSPLVLRELFHRAAVSPTLPVHAVTCEQWRGLHAAAAQLECELAAPRYSLVSTPAGVPLHFSTIRLTHIADAREDVYSDIHTALREFFTRARSAGAFHREHQLLRSALQRRIQKAERVCRAIRTDTAESNRAAAYRGFGTILMQHLESIPRGASAWTSPDTDPPLVIPLAPSLSPVQNAQRYFEKAKTAERSRLMAAERLRVYTSVLAQLHTLLSGLDAISSRSALRSFMKQNTESLRSLGALESPEDQERAPFRVFVVHGGFEVWAGKSSANNDDLTLHHARPEDLWFHARGASGSHVILKIASAAGEPGKRARAEAAGIAAYYSKMRNAKVVPVAMTRRKYVHKPKGAPPGTVVIAREEVVMATPALPQDTTHSTRDQHADA